MRYTTWLLSLLLGFVGVAQAQTTPLNPLTVSFQEACAGITLENLTPSDLCMAVMQAHPSPAYSTIPLDSITLENYTFYRLNGSPILYDAPNGAGVSQMGQGFNYVRAINTDIPGWIQTESELWVRAEDVVAVEPSALRGLHIDDGLPEPFAWILGNLFTAPYPGGPQAAETGLRKWRYNLVYIFASVEVDGWLWYLVGPDQWVEQRFVAKSLPVERPDGVSGRWVAVDLYEQTLIAYEEDTPVFATVISSGLTDWETNEGVFEVWYRLTVGSMSGSEGEHDAYSLDAVPWTMYFDGDISLHGTYWHDGFGYRRSHGCVNMSISDSAWVYEWTRTASYPLDPQTQTPITYVYVYSSGEYIN